MSQTDQPLVVLLQGERIGEARQTSGRISFTYDEEWRLRADATPLSLSMPLAGVEYGTNIVEAFMWGLLPDNDRVLERWGRDFHVSARNPFSMLRHVGMDCAGAVQFVPPARLDEATEAGFVTWLSPEEIAGRLRTLRRDPTAWQNSLEHGQFSLAGAQAKTALFREGEQWGQPSGRIPTTHILKPAIEGFDDHDLNEHICLAAAREAGLTAARSTIATFGEERALVVERYDRARVDGEWLRVHQEDACQALGIPPTRKYQNEGGPSVRQIVELLRTVDPDAAAQSIDAFVDTLAFNWLIGGTDGHAKNTSVLLNGPHVRLAPMYDVATALPYALFDRRRLRLAMSVGGEYRLDGIFRRHWVRMAEELRLDPERTLTRLDELIARLPDAFAKSAQRASEEHLDTDLPERVLRAVTDRIAECRRDLQR